MISLDLYHVILFSNWFDDQNCRIIGVSCARDNTDKDVFNLKLYQCPVDWYLTFPRALDILQDLEVWTS